MEISREQASDLLKVFESPVNKFSLKRLTDSERKLVEAAIKILTSKEEAPETTTPMDQKLFTVTLTSIQDHVNETTPYLSSGFFEKIRKGLANTTDKRISSDKLLGMIQEYKATAQTQTSIQELDPILNSLDHTKISEYLALMTKEGTIREVVNCNPLHLRLCFQSLGTFIEDSEGKDPNKVSTQNALIAQLLINPSSCQPFFEVLDSNEIASIFKKLSPDQKKAAIEICTTSQQSRNWNPIYKLIHGLSTAAVKEQNSPPTDQVLTNNQILNETLKQIPKDTNTAKGHILAGIVSGCVSGYLSKFPSQPEKTPTLETAHDDFLSTLSDAIVLTLKNIPELNSVVKTTINCYITAWQENHEWPLSGIDTQDSRRPIVAALYVAVGLKLEVIDYEELEMLTRLSRDEHVVRTAFVTASPSGKDCIKKTLTAPSPKPVFFQEKKLASLPSALR